MHGRAQEDKGLRKDVSIKPIRLKRTKKFNPDAFKYQELDLSVYGRYLVGFRTIFNEYLEDIEIYTKKTPNVQEYVLR